MQTRIAAVSLFVGLTSCVGTVPDPPLPTTDTPAGSVSIEDYPANADTWCSVGQELTTHEVLLSVAIPNGKGATPIVLKLIRCQSTTGFRSSPMAAVSADSMEPRAWFNGSVYVTSSNADSLKADVSFSWRTAHGAKGDCSESTTIPLRESANVKLRCGVTIATQFHATAGRSNNRLNPTAFHVTALARQGPRHSGRGLAVR